MSLQIIVEFGHFLAVLGFGIIVLGVVAVGLVAVVRCIGDGP